MLSLIALTLIVLPLVDTLMPLVPTRLEVAGTDNCIEPLLNPIVCAPCAFQSHEDIGSVVLLLLVVFPVTYMPPEV